MNLFEIKEKLASLIAAIQADAEWISEKGADPAVPMEEIKTKKAHRDELQERYDMLKAEHDRLEEAQRQSVEKQKPESRKDDIINKKAALYRALAEGKDVKKAYEGLGAIPANDPDLGQGNYLLPKNVSDQLITEPMETNPLREVARVTNITGYEEPRIGFNIEDADLEDVTDKETAHEIEMEGDSVQYGRYKAKVQATVKETVMRGTNTALVAAIEKNLRAALAKREKHFAFLSAEASAADTVHDHMSFYKQGAIKEVEGATMYEAIVKAYTDLADDFSANAQVMMRKSDYYAMIGTLSNTSEALFSEKPAMILGLPVKFCDKAVTPVVGDFSYYGINYDIDAVLDSDKDIKKGEYIFVLTAWGDQQIRLKSAFRLAKVNP